MSVIDLKAGIDWTVIEDALAMKTDILLMQYIIALNLRVIGLKDNKGYNLIHLSVLAMKADAIHALVHYARDTQKEPREAIESWLNERSDKDKFTPLHFASFKGHFATIQALIDHGADPLLENDSGLNVLHLAAQGDAARSVYLFIKEKNIDINKRDHFGGTPLHWACHNNSEMALTFLLAWNPDINI